MAPYQNLRWVTDSHETWAYYEQYVDRLPVNPPGAHLAEGDIEMAQIDIRNWYDRDELEFRPRLRDNVQWVNRITLARDEDAPELDGDYGYDCD